MLLLIALLSTVAFSQTGLEQYSKIGAFGVCTDSALASPPNYSRQFSGNTAAQCQIDCSQEALCAGYSFCTRNSRCALWIDRNDAGMPMKNPAKPPNANGWERHVYQANDPWRLGVSRIVKTETGQAGAADWSCYARSDVCNSGTINVGGVVVSYTGPIRHTQLFTANCPAGYTGTVGLVCTTTVVTYRPGSGTCTRQCPSTVLTSGSVSFTTMPLLHTHTQTFVCGANSTGTIVGTCLNGVTRITSGACQTTVCPASTQTRGSAQVTFPQSNHGVAVNIQCPSGNTGNVSAVCSNGSWINVTGTCVVEIYSGPYVGVCRDLSVQPGFGPNGGASPPNFSREGLTSAQCRAMCDGENLCVGYSYGGVSGVRCALFVNKEIADCPDKSGWEKHTYQDGWKVSTSTITGGSGDAGWICYRRNNTPQPPMNVQYTHLGVGVCENNNAASPPNYSRNGFATTCRAECEATPRCLGYSIRVNHRCALWVDTPFASLGAKGGWERHAGEHMWNTGADAITRGSGDAGWSCYRRNTATGGTTPVTNYLAVGTGICTNSSGVSSPNLSADGRTLASCQSSCNNTQGCEGISFYTIMNRNRCALWIDRSVLTIPVPAGWGRHPATSSAYVAGSWDLTHASGHVGWTCYNRVTVMAGGR